jgi:hypothetical protein
MNDRPLALAFALNKTAKNNCFEQTKTSEDQNVEFNFTSSKINFDHFVKT